jgi:glycosyltransferase involved in cell wall biosynthesis
MILGIDASTVGSGGAKRHLIEILNCFEPSKQMFTQIIIWGRQNVLDQIPDAPHLVKYSHPLLNKGLLSRVFWQLFIRDKQFINEIDVLFSPFGTYIGNFRPYATMSRNMLVFDKEEQKRFGLSWYRLKFILLFYVQRASFRNSQGLIFISKYAKDIISKHVDYTQVRTAIIHHGISVEFEKKPLEQKILSEYSLLNPFKLLYVSTIFHYKHQLNVVDAIVRLRKMGIPVALKLIGGTGQREIGKALEEKIQKVDPEGEFITWLKDVGLSEVVDHYHSSDAFVFASSCENMPNILMEAMASGLPII